MDSQWISPLLVAVGVAIGVGREIMQGGRRAEKIDVCERRLNAHSERMDQIQAELGDTQQRVSNIEGRHHARG